MRILRVNRLWVPAFLFFYALVTTASFTEHTSSLTHTLNAGARSETSSKRLHVARSWQKRFAEDAVAQTGPDNAFSVPPDATKTTLTPTEQATHSPKASTPSRAPPASSSFCRQIHRRINNFFEEQRMSIMSQTVTFILAGGRADRLSPIMSGKPSFFHLAGCSAFWISPSPTA